jgi:hypothetical protein
MSRILKWHREAAYEISNALIQENKRVAYYAGGGGDGWARSYGAGNFRSPDYAAIIAKHYEKRKADSASRAKEGM